MRTVVKILAVTVILILSCCANFGTGGLSYTPYSAEYTIAPYPLCNESANEETKRLFEYLLSIYGKKTLAGATMDGDEFEAFMNYCRTGRQPAVRCYDFIFTAGDPDLDWVTNFAVDQAIEFHTKSGGIVEFCWHWFAPDKEGRRESFYAYHPLWLEEKWTKGTKLTPKSALDPDGPYYRYILRDIDAVAKQIKRLEAAGVPVLFRPLHEGGRGFLGPVFWWGNGGAAEYRELWRFLYDKLTYEYNCTNIIWVNNGERWGYYPGADYCDIISYDYYGKVGPEAGYDFGKLEFSRTLRLADSKKMIALSENDRIPNPNYMFDEKTYSPWLWFAPWYGEYAYYETYNSYAHLNEVYNSDYVITLDELPNFDGFQRDIGTGYEYNFNKWGLTGEIQISLAQILKIDENDIKNNEIDCKNYYLYVYGDAVIIDEGYTYKNLTICCMENTSLTINNLKIQNSGREPAIKAMGALTITEFGDCNYTRNMN
ncbi:MAG: glycosyl hydrolase [Christensenellales bacterium]